MPNAAFPIVTGTSIIERGMDLRDWFAAQALPILAKYGPNGHAPADMVASAAYEYADAMMKARKA